MNVILISQLFSNTRGGSEYVFSLIADNLANNNHSAYIITNKIVGEDYKTRKNIHLFFVPPTIQYKGGLPTGFINNIRFIISAVLAGIKIIKNNDIDLIHSNDFSPALAGSILSFITRKPHITTVHDIFTLCGKDYWKEWAKQMSASKMNAMIGPTFEKLILKLPHDAIHTVSEATKDDLIKFGAKKPIHVIMNSIRQTPATQKTTNYSQFIYVGRLIFYKNVDVIIRAVSLLKETIPDIKLVIIGSGPQKQLLVDLVKKLGVEKNIEFAGHVSAEEKVNLIANSNALLFPSLCEGFGLVILEAFDQRKPVLVSNMKPMSDIVSHGETGYVLDPHDEKVWAEHMSVLLKNPAKSAEMGENGNTVMKTTYSEKTMYHKLIEMYEKYIKKR